MRTLLVALALLGCNHLSGGSDRCSGLSLAECRLTDGCKPDTCFACLCNLAYRGCLPATETPAMCPGLGCAGASCCATASQCPQGGEACVPPVAPPLCGGACNTESGNCTSDADCKPHGATLVCDPIACSCNGQMQCEPGCTDDTPCTPLGEVCDVATARCVAHACSQPSGCPANFDCTGGSCMRRPCSSDLDCDGYCVNGACFDQTGTCTPLVP
jgi:hypothetical protein